MWKPRVLDPGVVFLVGQNCRQNDDCVEGFRVFFRVFLVGRVRSFFHLRSAYILGSLLNNLSVTDCILLTMFAVSHFLSLGSFIPSPQYHNHHLSFIVPIHTDTYQRTEPNPSFLLFSLIFSPLFTPRRCLGLYLAHPLPSPLSPPLVHICCNPFCSSSVDPRCN